MFLVMWLSVVFDKARGSGGGINYNDQKSWKGKCSTGKEQSPIDIVTAKAKGDFKTRNTHGEKKERLLFFY